MARRRRPWAITTAIVWGTYLLVVAVGVVVLPKGGANEKGCSLFECLSPAGAWLTATLWGGWPVVLVLNIVAVLIVNAKQRKKDTEAEERRARWQE